MSTLAVVTVLSVVLTGIAFWLAAAVLRQQRACPQCRIPFDVLNDPAIPPTYEVCTCRTCRNAAVLVHGHRARLALCPACRQRALQTPCVRLPDEDGEIRVEVREDCHLCGHDDVRVFRGPLPPRGIVVRFPGPRRDRAVRRSG